MPTTDCGFENSPIQLASRGPTLLVEIGFDLTYKPDSDVRPNLPPAQYHALVDTGARMTCIDSDLAVGLNLPIVDRQNVAGVLGAGRVNVYLAQIYVPGFLGTFSGRFFGAHLIAGGQPHSALIGRDFLRHFKMTYDGRTGAVTLSND